MDEDIVVKIFTNHFGTAPTELTRCAMGIGNYVYIAAGAGERCVIRCSDTPGAYRDTVHWLTQLAPLGIPVPRVLGEGSIGSYVYLILTWFPGEDLGIVYPQLTREEKRGIAKSVLGIQNRVAALRLEVPADWSWWDSFVWDMLDRAEHRIRKNGYFGPEKVDKLRAAADELRPYFDCVQPVAYLDDISSKNLLIHEGRVSGVVDIDWMGIGDRLTFAALTRMALLNMNCDYDYVNCLLEIIQPNAAQRRAFAFYTLLYCVDFMGERGMRFGDKQVPVSPEIIDRLNGIFDRLWAEWIDNGSAHGYNS